MEFGLFTLEYLFDENGVNLCIKKETAINVSLKSNKRINAQDFRVPLQYLNEDLANLQKGKKLSVDDSAYYIRSINWNSVFPQIRNLVTLKSTFIYDMCFMLGDYSDGELQLRALFEIRMGFINIFILKKEDLPNALYCCEFDSDIKIEHSGNKMHVTNPNRSCRSYSTS